MHGVPSGGLDLKDNQDSLCIHFCIGLARKPVDWRSAEQHVDDEQVI